MGGATWAALRVSAARLRARPLRPALVVSGVALAFAMAVAVVGGSLVARQQALHQGLASLPADSRGFRVDRFGLPLRAQAYRREDLAVRRVLGTLAAGQVRRVVFFRQLRVHGRLVEIAAVDRLPEILELQGGRLPRTCTSAGCEVVAVGGGPARLAEGDVRLDLVGSARLRDPNLFGYISAAGASPAAPPLLLLAPSVEALQRYPALSPYYRVYSWLSPLRAERLHTWQIRRTLAAESRAQNTLYATDSAFRLSSPDEELLSADHRGRVAARRLMLVGGETSALLLGFAVIAAIGLRRGLASERRRLLARGARRWQSWLTLGGEVGAMTLIGALAGIAGGSAVVAAVAAGAGQPAGAILAHSLLAPWTIAALLGGAVAVTLVLAAATFTRDDETGRRRVQLVDVAALGAAVAVAVGLSRGALDPEHVTGGNTVLLLVLPALVCFVAAVVLARLLGPAMRFAERLTRGRALSLRLGVLALARAPSRTVVSCAFIAVALGLALFAAAYRATLARGAADQAGFQVPLDYSVTEGSKLVLPLDAAPLRRYAAIEPGARAYPIVRVGATTPGAGAAVLSPTVLGVPAGAIRRLHWRSDYSPLSRDEIVRRLAAGGEPALAGVALPPGRHVLSSRARVRGAGVVVRLVVADERGRVSFVRLGRPPTGGATRLSARLENERPANLLGLELALPEGEAFTLAHRDAEGEVAIVPSGELDLGPLLDRGRELTRWQGWRLSTGGDVLAHGEGTRVRYAFQDTGRNLVLRQPQPTDDAAMPVVVSPEIARAAGGVGGTTTLDFQDTQIEARVVGVASRLPSVPAETGPFVLADEAWLSTAIDANAPGEGTPREIWIAAPGDAGRAAAALSRPPFASLDVASRAAEEHRLASDPLARATAIALGAAGLLALLLAVLGFWVGVVSELHDEKSDFFDLEAQGLAPAAMRRQLRLRGAVLLAVGLAGGLGLAALLSRLVVSLIRVSATTGVPEPPLRLDPAWLAGGLGVVALVAAALLVAEGASLASFRGARPERASWSLE